MNFRIPNPSQPLLKPVSTQQRSALRHSAISYIPLNQNYGIAYAQNVGIETAKELKCNYVIFFDQDSKIEKKYPLAILNEYIKLETKIDNFPILGPSIINETPNKKYK